MSQTVPNPSTNDTTQQDDEIDLIALLLTLLRGWKTILTCALLGLALGVTYSRYVQPTYKTDALIQIDEKSQGIAALGQISQNWLVSLKVRQKPNVSLLSHVWY